MAKDNTKAKRQSVRDLRNDLKVIAEHHQDAMAMQKSGMNVTAALAILEERHALVLKELSDRNDLDALLMHPLQAMPPQDDENSEEELHELESTESTRDDAVTAAPGRPKANTEITDFDARYAAVKPTDVAKKLIRYDRKAEEVDGRSTRSVARFWTRLARQWTGLQRDERDLPFAVYAIADDTMAAFVKRTWTPEMPLNEFKAQLISHFEADTKTAATATLTRPLASGASLQGHINDFTEAVETLSAFNFETGTTNDKASTIDSFPAGPQQFAATLRDARPELTRELEKQLILSEAMTLSQAFDFVLRLHGQYDVKRKTERPAQQTSESGKAPVCTYCTGKGLRPRQCAHRTSECKRKQGARPGYTTTQRPSLVNVPKKPFAAARTRDVSSSTGGPPNRKRGTCHHCGQVGHYKSDCPELTSTPNVKRDQGYALFVGGVEMDIAPQDEFTISLEINGERTVASIDTGASVTIIDPQFAARIGLASTTSEHTVVLVGGEELRNPRQTAEPITLTSGKFVTTCRPLVSRTTSGLDVQLGRDVMSALRIGVTYRSTTSLSLEEEIAMMRIADDQINLCLHEDVEKTQRMEKQLHELIKENQSLPASSFIDHESATVAIPTGPNPYRRPQYPIRHAFKDKVNETIKNWMDNDIIFRRTTRTRYRLPILAAPKPDLEGNVVGVRVCLDARALNEAIPEDAKVDAMEAPRVHDILTFAAQHKHYATFDLASAFLQLRLAEESKELTTFEHLGVQYSFNRLPFGVKFASSACQRAISNVLSGLEERIRLYTDDLLVAGDSEEELIENVRMVLTRFNEHRVRVNWKKTVLGAETIALLGHRISNGRIGPNLAKVDKWIKQPMPTSAGAVQARIGFASYYRRHVPMFADYEARLRRFRGMRKRTPVTLTEDEATACRDMIEAIAKAPLLHTVSCPSPELEVHSDASKFGAGGALFERVGDELRTIGHYAKTWSKSERNWSTAKQEAAALVLTLRHFDPYIYGRKVKVFTDNAALSFVNRTSQTNSHVERWLHVIQSYWLDIHHISGELNEVPDVLSRLQTTPSIRLQRGEGGVNDTASADPDQTTTAHVGGTTTRSAGRNDRQDCSTQTERSKDVEDYGWLREPEMERRPEIVRKAHRLGHGGQRAVVDRVKAAGWDWKGMSTQVKCEIKDCKVCSIFNARRQAYHASRRKVAKLPGREWHADTLTLWSGSDYEAVLVCVDAFTRMTLLEPLPNKTAEATAAALWRMFSRVGLPSLLLMDNGPEFQNELMKELAELMGTKEIFVAPHHPEGNSIAERAVGRASDTIHKLVADKVSRSSTQDGSAQDLTGKDWAPYLPLTEYVLNTSLSQATSHRSLELFLGRKTNFPTFTEDDFTVARDGSTREAGDDEDKLQERMRIVSDKLIPALKHELAVRTKNDVERFASARRIIEPLKIGDRVVAERTTKRAKGQSKFLGPYRVAKVTRRGNYFLEDSAGTQLARSFPMPRLRLLERDENDGYEPQFEVDRIIDHEIHDGRVLYTVRWKGCDPAQDTLEPESNLSNALQKLKAYKKKARIVERVDDAARPRPKNVGRQEASTSKRPRQTRRVRS